ncbi:hypothetical protein EYY60_08345 [Flavobacterium zhairuonense]|uniref:hypothetical protein n=1 Tax=Flavobacterium zhairuonense TaxID=2493631 RepID=UPI001052247D|nr:hypothetical protein [Flavobacterium zhairuonense]KAF2511432.1 hypothetical protein EYY60_08345 [Flavobacterium zhairuonense]
MKNIYLSLCVFYSTLSIGQSILLPSENIRNAFEKQYPKKKPVWTIVFSKSETDVNFAAKFMSKPKTLAFTIYDSQGNFKDYKEQITSAKLPKSAHLYLDTNYRTNIASKEKSKSKSKTKSVPLTLGEMYSVLDAENEITYEVKVKKEGKNYNLIFDKDGNLTKTIVME